MYVTEVLVERFRSCEWVQIPLRPEVTVLAGDNNGFRWITPGSFLTLVYWMIASAGFALYVAHFATYNKTNGTMAGVIVLLIRPWITNLAIQLGLEFDAETVRQRAVAGGLLADLWALFFSAPVPLVLWGWGGGPICGWDGGLLWCWGRWPLGAALELRRGVRGLPACGIAAQPVFPASRTKYPGSAGAAGPGTAIPSCWGSGSRSS
ncbi:hypothetical protein GCM10010521_43710 [Streptomyces rameus]|uniref:Uncharacterized protein n=1 Tax=Streptomyces rameus TaxID=68261 RepID=A0ABP6NKN8_9ACTN